MGENVISNTVFRLYEEVGEKYVCVFIGQVQYKLRSLL
jgi:hypothetical protein